jgi:hypothetical protein
MRRRVPLLEFKAANTEQHENKAVNVGKLDIAAFQQGASAAESPDLGIDFRSDESGEEESISQTAAVPTTKQISRTKPERIFADLENVCCARACVDNLDIDRVAVLRQQYSSEPLRRVYIARTLEKAARPFPFNNPEFCDASFRHAIGFSKSKHDTVAHAVRLAGSADVAIQQFLSTPQIRSELPRDLNKSKAGCRRSASLSFSLSATFVTPVCAILQFLFNNSHPASDGAFCLYEYWPGPDLFELFLAQTEQKDAPRLTSLRNIFRMIIRKYKIRQPATNTHDTCPVCAELRARVKLSVPDAAVKLEKHLTLVRQERVFMYFRSNFSLQHPQLEIVVFEDCCFLASSPLLS